jgi:4-hydroxybenzoate polyprenyltransferase
MSPEDDDAEGPEDTEVLITLETQAGRTNLKGESLGKGARKPSADMATTEGRQARSMDPDTAAIDGDLRGKPEEEHYLGWRVGLSRKIAAYIELIRPFTLLAPLFGGLGGALLALIHQDFSGFEWGTLIFGVATLMMLNAASNCLNAAYDAHIDAINKPYRPIPRGLVTREEASSLALLIYFFAFFRAILISLQFWAIVTLITLVTIYYSMPPVRLKKRLWISNITIAFGRGGLGFLAAWTIFGDPMDPMPWVIGGILFIFLVGATTSKDFTDLEGDRKYGMRTLPVVYGPRKAALITTPFFVAPLLLIPIGVLRGYLIEEANYLMALSVWGVYVMYMLQGHAMDKDPNFENSPVWKHMYLMLFALQLGFALVYAYDYIAARGGL